MHPPTDAFDYIRDRCDLVVVGSDELWRLDYTREGFWPFRSRVEKNPWAPPFPNVYWPDAIELRVPNVQSIFTAAGVPHGAKTALVISTTLNPALEQLIRRYKSAGHTVLGLSHALEGVDVDLSSHPDECSLFVTTQGLCLWATEESCPRRRATE
jgi:hypothetical protein